MPAYKPLPPEALSILREFAVPPRLMAHLILVHDVANKLVSRLHLAFPKLQFNEEEVFFGAATHDIGKTVCRGELSHSGHLHESKGVELMQSLDISDRRARFAMSHGNWNTDPTVQLEDLLVALADKCWKGKRVSELESKVVHEIAEQTGKADWEVFSTFDDIVQDLSNSADERLAWQRQFPAG